MPITKVSKEKASELKIIPERLKQLDLMLNKWVAEKINPTFVIKIMRYGQSIFEGETIGDQDLCGNHEL